MIERLKRWMCSHGLHWFVVREICCGHSRDIVCKWCGHIQQDNYDDFFDGMKMS